MSYVFMEKVIKNIWTSIQGYGSVSYTHLDVYKRQVMDHVEENYNYRYIFLTLTVRNCYGEDLRDTLDLMTKSFNKLSERKAFKQAVKGYFRSLEITYNLSLIHI